MSPKCRYVADLGLCEARRGARGDAPLMLQQLGTQIGNHPRTAAIPPVVVAISPEVVAAYERELRIPFRTASMCPRAVDKQPDVEKQTPTPWRVR